ncbi:MAG TPA: YXWGXW repeat-containing protein [Bryobacteraceae bacterium]|nr:YXWGXW repeat-containing protein [Bryobacteraceae bacterium]
MRTTLRILLMAALLGSFAYAGVVFSVNLAPPPITVFDQPPCPGDGYIWTPGYYQYGDYGWYWVPGTWVLPPSAGVLWTPGFWGFDAGHYVWHAGYWGPRVGFYGGINYGNGYFGTGFTGGRWDGKVFRHNTAIANVDVHNVHNVYEDRTVIRNVTGPNHSFNGQGGATVRPTREEENFGRQQHQGPTQAQVSHAQEAHENHLAAHGAPRRR